MKTRSDRSQTLGSPPESAPVANNEDNRSPVLLQPSAQSPKLRIYETLFLFNQGVDHIVALLHTLEDFPFADRDSMQCSIVEIEEVRCDINADFTEHLAASERFDKGHFWRQHRAFEKKWKDPDDVYIDVMTREEERKKLGLPLRVVGSILPHSAVAQAEELWEAEQERKQNGDQKRTSTKRRARKKQL